MFVIYRFVTRVWPSFHPFSVNFYEDCPLSGGFTVYKRKSLTGGGDKLLTLKQRKGIQKYSRVTLTPVPNSFNLAKFKCRKLVTFLGTFEQILFMYTLLWLSYQQKSLRKIEIFATSFLCKYYNSDTNLFYWVYSFFVRKRPEKSRGKHYWRHQNFCQFLPAFWYRSMLPFYKKKIRISNSLMLKRLPRSGNKKANSLTWAIRVENFMSIWKMHRRRFFNFHMY